VSLAAGSLGARLACRTELELAVLVGWQASGKSTFVASRFASTHLAASKDLIAPARWHGTRVGCQNCDHAL
jgi:hypothetical protein